MLFFLFTENEKWNASIHFLFSIFFSKLKMKSEKQKFASFIIYWH